MQTTERNLLNIAEKVADRLVVADPGEARRIYERLGETDIQRVDGHLALVLNDSVLCVVDLADHGVQ